MSLRKYLSDYQTVTTIDENGREKRTVVYRGPLFESSLDQEALTVFRKRSLLLVGLVSVIQIFVGFLDNPGMYTFYISLPYVLSFFPLVYLAAGVLRLPKETRKYRRDEIGYSFNQIKSSSWFLMALLSVGVLGEIAFLIFSFSSKILITEVSFLGLEIISLAFCFGLVRLHKQVTITQIKDDQNRD